MTDEFFGAETVCVEPAVDDLDEVEIALRLGERISDSALSWICHAAHPADSFSVLGMGRSSGGSAAPTGTASSEGWVSNCPR